MFNEWLPWLAEPGRTAGNDKRTPRVVVSYCRTICSGVAATMQAAMAGMVVSLRCRARLCPVQDREKEKQ